MDIDHALELAAAHLDAGRLDDAEALCTQILQARRDPYALYFLGWIYQLRDRHDLALPFLQEAADADPRFADARFRLGLTHYHLGLVSRDKRKLDDAIAAYTAALMLDS